ncbi:aldo/keto reductase [Nakamurella leprariae]|uniref:aldo/keto reductase n=1 Tax=Nakamurella leprariae TaxID=2803911 RepID=UPI0038B35DCB
MNIPDVTLNNGVTIPQLGFGVFQIKPEDTAAAVKAALEVGYRHIDTAEMYGNEAGVAQGIEDAGVDPAEVFVTSKINNNAHGYDKAMAAFEQTLKELRTDAVDLMLIHWPLPTVGDFVGTWKALEQVYSEGRARSIGVSNFQPVHLQRLTDETSVVPAVNQIEVHPYFTQDALLAENARRGIATEAWSPIAQGDVLDDATIVEIAQAVGKSPAQVVLRWHLQRGSIVFPKSSTPSRMRENAGLFDFELTDEQVRRISGLDRNGRRGPDPDTFDRIPD